MRIVAPLVFAYALALPFTAAAQVQTNFWSGGGVRIGTSSTTCDSTIRGALRFNDTSKEVELCNGTTWTRIVNTVTSGPVAPAGSGYFVLTATTWNGNLGGTTGADAKCLTELTGNTNWKYYTAANTAGQLVASKVKAFICESNGTCNNLIPLTSYYFAKVGDANAGGASFTTNASGLGPLDDISWAAANYFSGTYNYWTNRSAGSNTTWPSGGASSSGSGASCFGFTSSAATGAYIGQSGSTQLMRWTTAASACSNSHPIICFVNP